MATELTVRNHNSVGQSEWQMLREQAAALVPTGFLPAAVNTPEKAVAIMLKGRELGIPAMYALSNIAVIQGKPAANAELMLALIYRDHGDDAIQFVEASNTRAVISYKRRSWRERQTFAFTIEDARTAGLSGGNWQKYPGAMLRARCISAVARLAFPDSIGGMYTPEELGAVEDAEGEVVPGEHTAPISHPRLTEIPAGLAAAIEEVAPNAAAISKLHRRYAQLSREADALGVRVHPIPHNATENEITDLGLDLKNRVVEAQRAALAPVIEATR